VKFAGIIWDSETVAAEAVGGTLGFTAADMPYPNPNIDAVRHRTMRIVLKRFPFSIVFSSFFGLFYSYLFKLGISLKHLYRSVILLAGEKGDVKCLRLNFRVNPAFAFA